MSFSTHGDKENHNEIGLCECSSVKSMEVVEISPTQLKGNTCKQST